MTTEYDRKFDMLRVGYMVVDKFGADIKEGDRVLYVNLSREIKIGIVNEILGEIVGLKGASFHKCKNLVLFEPYRSLYPELFI